MTKDKFIEMQTKFEKKKQKKRDREKRREIRKHQKGTMRAFKYFCRKIECYGYDFKDYYLDYKIGRNYDYYPYIEDIKEKLTQKYPFLTFRLKYSDHFIGDPRSYIRLSLNVKEN